MLSRKFRLPPDESFAGARTTATRFFLLKSKKQDLGFSRFGFVVSKKVDTRAVVRNRLRRKLATIVSATQADAGYDMLIIAKKDALEDQEAGGQELKKAIEKIYKE